MIAFLFEIFPVFLFFIAFKWYGMYVATVVGMASTLLQVLINRVWKGSFDKKQLITLAVFFIFGSMTLYFHNPIFVKWKPTVIFWIFAIVLLVSHFTKKPMMQRLLENMLENTTLTDRIWIKLNLVWALFFTGLGALNLYIAYCYSNDAWVNFKFYGISGLLLLLSIAQAIYLTRVMVESKKT